MEVCLLLRVYCIYINSYNKNKKRYEVDNIISKDNHVHATLQLLKLCYPWRVDENHC